MSQAGIYTITNSTNGKQYVGSAVNVSRRWREHVSTLLSSTHRNSLLQRSWDKYGKDVFVFAIIESVFNKDDLITREQYWIDHLDVFNSGFNLAPKAGSSLGQKRSPETIAKFKLFQSNRSSEHQARITLAKTGFVHSEATKIKISIGGKGLKRSEITRNRMSVARKGTKLSPERVAQMREIRKGKTATVETKAKMSAAHLLRHQKIRTLRND